MRWQDIIKKWTPKKRSILNRIVKQDCREVYTREGAWTNRVIEKEPRKPREEHQFFKLLKGKFSLYWVWSSEEVKKAKEDLRRQYQKVVNEWCNVDKKRHIPVYISLKPKVKKLGLYFKKGKGKGSIVLFPIRCVYPIEPNSCWCATSGMMADALRHEYAHHLDGASGHGITFQEAYERIRDREVKVSAEYQKER